MTTKRAVAIGNREHTRQAALEALATLDAYQWRTVSELAHAHVTGSLSLDGWCAATAAIIDQALARLELDGPANILRKGR